MNWNYLELDLAARRLARIPRWGRIIASIVNQPRRAERIKNEASLLWELYAHVENGPCDLETAGLIDGGLENENAGRLGLTDETDQIAVFRRPAANRKWQVRLALDLWSKIAFDMMCGVNGDGSTLPVDRISDWENVCENRIIPQLCTRSDFF